MKILVACEFSGTVRDAFAARGHDAWSCDLLPTERPGNHIQGDVLAVLDQGWDLMIAHPPCTYLTNSGICHLRPRRNARQPRGYRRWHHMLQAAAFFNALLNAPIPRIAVENPVPHRYATALIGRYSQKIQPWEFNHGESKGTCLWLKNLPPLMATVLHTGREQRLHRLPPSPYRWKLRSATYPGIAQAMADQWGSNERFAASVK